MNEIAVYAMHGIVKQKDSSLLAHHTLDSWELFEDHLARRMQKYVPLAAALAGEGDALTIDDATLSAKHAADLAWEYGHETTIFINPYFVFAEKPYYLHRLSTMVDATTIDKVHWNGKLLPLTSLPEKKEFREQVKQRLCQLSAESERTALIESLAVQLKPSNNTLPDCLATLSTIQLRELRSRGVSIQNHGWSHAHFGSLSDEEVRRDIHDGGQWLEQMGFSRESYFAVPFGDVLPRHANESLFCSVWFTLDSSLGSGPIGSRRWKHPRVWNRLPLRPSKI